VKKLGLFFLGLGVVLDAQPISTGSGTVVTHPIPDPLVRRDGRRTITAEQWTQEHRGELLAIFEREISGRTPATPLAMSAEVRDDSLIENGRIRRRQVRLTFRSEFGAATAELLVYAPANATKPVPVFLGLNSGGNWTVSRDTGVLDANEASRGRHERRWPVDFITTAGYAVATLCCDDFFPDKDENSFPQSMQRLFPSAERGPGPEQWGAIATWAWGLSRALDYLGTDPQFDAGRVAVIGHSRLGKAALWAGARDPRFALVISNDSGCGGAALSKRIAGETVQAINTRFPHWFCTNFRRYDNREEALPVDQHQVIALVAPRAIAVGSAFEDTWADPVGEKLALTGAQPVFALFGIPPLDAPATERDRRLHYHVRNGEHDIILSDWQEYVAFADVVFGQAAR